MGIPSGARRPMRRELSLDYDGEIWEHFRGDDAPSMTIKVYRTGGGIKVGCTFVSDAAFQKIVEIYNKG